jgi:ABC-2 type transport system permease protein
MRAVMASEWLKLRTLRATKVMVSIAVTLPILVATLTAWFITVDSSFDFGELVQGITGLALMSSLICGVPVALSITSEHSSGTIRTTYAITPRRSRVLIAKTIVAAMLSGIAAVVAALLFVTLSALILNVRGANLVLSSDGEIIGILALYVAVWIGVSWLFLSVGLLLRSTALALVLLFSYIFIIETLVATLLRQVGLESLAKWAPYEAAATAMLNEPMGLGRPGGVIWFCIVAAALLLLAAGLEQRRDA